MALVAGAAAVVAASMYIDGKFAIRKDIYQLRKLRAVTKRYTEAVAKKRVSLYYLFEDNARLQPNLECIWSREGCYTWAQTYERVNQYAQWYLSLGVKSRDLVAFYLTNSPDFIFAWLGLWAIGAAPAMINYNLTGDALIHCLKISGAKLLLVDEDSTIGTRVDEVKDRVEELGMRICVLDMKRKSEIQRLKNPERPADAYRDGVEGRWPMCLFYTSGTTGLPKAVPFDILRGFLLGVSRAAGYDRTEDDDRWYDCMPYYHGTGGVMAVTMMMTGITLCIGKRFSTSKFWSEVVDSRSTWITYVGETARYLLATPPSPLDKAHRVRCMYGNGLRPDVWFKFRERFNVPEVVEFFNSSEGVFSMLNHSRGDYLATCVGSQGLISRYMSRNTVVPVLVDAITGAVARDPKTGFAIRQPYDQGGEIIIQLAAESDFAGYHNNPEATAKKYERDVFKEGDLYYRSGDALRRTNDGRWFFLDRLGDTFRWKGENVSTAEVQEVLGKYPGVVEANVYGVALPAHDGRAGCAAIFIDPNIQHEFDYAGLLKHSRTHLPKYAVPLFLRIVKEMTPIHNNKQNKVPLREEGVDPGKVKLTDKIFVISENGKGTTYEPFHVDHWESLQLGKASL